MKAKHPFVSLIFLNLSSFLILTTAEYVQCRGEHPDCFDFPGTLKHSVEMDSAPLNLLKLVWSTVLLKQ